ncbi:MAG: M24 family metallopeptidase [Eubacteriales bacterium]|nr:M24 family metallopeptidase [Eubacteriales bacterium]
MQQRLKLYSILQEAGIDCAILTTPANVIYASDFAVPYASGFMGDMSADLPMVTAVLNVQEKSMQLVASEFYRSKIERAGLQSDTFFYESFHHLHAYEPNRNFDRALQQAMQAFSAGRAYTVGVEGNGMPYRVLETIRGMIPNATVRDVTEYLNKSRRIKTMAELEKLHAAAASADAAQNRLLEIARTPGNYTEMDIWYEVQKAASSAAGHLTPFIGELVTGPASGMSDYPLGPTLREVHAGDTGIMDISPRVNGYWADCSNAVVFWAEPTEEQRRYFGAVKAAYEAGRDAIRPGVTFAAANEAMVNAYHRYGFELCSYLGHQIGVHVNEGARFTPKDTTAIEKDMVVCIEPQLYTGKQGKTGVRLERMLHVQTDGVEELNHFAWGMPV